jgi:DNA-binding protein HU-beta
MPMIKKQLVNLVANKAHLTKKGAREAIDTFLGEITKSLRKGEKVVLSGFGTFLITKREDKPVTIPGTGKRIIVKSHKAARFVPGKPLKKEVK